MENIKDFDLHEPPKPASRPRPPRKGERPAHEENSVWFTHDPAIYHDEVSGKYYVYGTGAICLESKDMIDWRTVGKVIPNPPEESMIHVGGDAIWAPDIVKVGNEYRLYGSNSSWGVRQSCIFLAVSDKACGPFTPKAPVLKTTNNSPCNAIDANIVEDVKTKKQYMVYGSFWGGIYMIQLDKETGLAKDPGVGINIARRPAWNDGSLEGPYIRYNNDFGYYYLFVSYGSLNSDYNIRVGRSKNITGPYLDFNGRNLMEPDTDYKTGYMIACGYGFDGSQMYMGPGHNSVLCDFDDEWYLVSHIREKNFVRTGPSTMHVRKMEWSKDGWPFVSPMQYSGERVCKVEKEDVVGVYEFLKLVPEAPQGIRRTVKLEFREDNTVLLCGYLEGTWEIVSDGEVSFSYNNETYEVKFLPGWDFDLWKKVVTFTGIGNGGISVWGKRDF